MDYYSCYYPSDDLHFIFLIFTTTLAHILSQQSHKTKVFIYILMIHKSHPPVQILIPTTCVCQDSIKRTLLEQSTAHTCWQNETCRRSGLHCVLSRAFVLHVAMATSTAAIQIAISPMRLCLAASSQINLKEHICPT